MIESKTSQVKRLVAAGEYKLALQICKEWNYTNQTYRDKLRLGYECLMYPEFYRQIGKDPESNYEEAVRILKIVYGDTKSS